MAKLHINSFKVPDPKFKLPEFVERPVDLPLAELSDNARIILAKRYLTKNEDGQPIEEAEDMFWRVAYYVAREDARYGATQEEVVERARDFYLLMTQRLFEPNSPTLMNAGRPLGQLSACFVLPVDDALSNGKSGIYDTLRSMALVHQSGGGTGFSFSRLRPEGSIVRSTTGVASGPVSFMRLYDASTEVVKQGGTRRGANMGILRVDHPDIRKFITCKEDVTQITNFNISVAVTDAFMEALKKGEKYDLLDPRDGTVVGQEDAREIFDLIVEGAWSTGEPGVFFIDQANYYNPVPKLGSYEATNPCGEQPLLPYDVCNLGSINVGHPLFIRDNVPADAHWRERIDWEAMADVIHRSVHFLDNVIDANSYPLPEIADLARKIRRIGAGIMGWADLLVRLGIPYNSPEAIEFAEEFAAFFDEQTKVASERLAEQRGVFPAWEESIWGPDETCARDKNGNRIRPMRRLRNCNTNTVAPTGTISIIADCSGGIEPLFAVAFMRNQAGVLMPDVNKEFVRIAKEQGWYSDELMRQIAEEGHIHFPEVPAEVQRAFVTAHDVSPEWHVRMQAAWQKHIDSAISKTCNFPQEATREDVREIYMLAHELGCKGVTVYRDGSRPMQVLSTGKTAKQEAAEKKVVEVSEELATAKAEIERLRRELEEARGGDVQRRAVRGRPDVVAGRTYKMASPLGSMFVTINELPPGKPFEVFVTLGKAGSAAMADVEAIGRLISLALRSGISIDAIHKQLRGISTERAVGFGPNKVLSVPDAIAQAIERWVKDKEGVQQELPVDSVGAVGHSMAVPALSVPADSATDIGGSCPDCGSELRYSEGCNRCLVCGYSACG